MKKALSFAVALGLVAGMAYTASAAEISWTGDARWRGVYKNNVDGTDAASDRTQNMDQRYRLNGKIAASDDVTIGTRIVLTDQMFGNNQPGTMTSSGANSVGGAPAANAHTHEVGRDSHTVDRAWMDVNAFGGKWSFGRMPASWGNKFFGWGASVDRVKATYKSGDLTFAGYLQKNAEGAGNNGDGDRDTWGALVIGKAGDTKWGVIANYMTSDTAAAKANGRNTGYLADGFFVTKAGPATILGELFMSGGDLGENSQGDSIFGGFVGGAMAAGPATVKGLIAYYDNNEGAVGTRSCDNDFAPSLLIGTCQETAVINFGGTTGIDDSTMLIGVGADMKVNEKMSVGALLGYLNASDKANVDLTEIDLTMSYELAQNATYRLGIATGLWDGRSASDDSLFVVGNSVQVKF